ncbi:MAG: SPASM domain-containing protein [Candidatus Vogelbacteria bacterium]|nr:SPASM domain-containing protein [Candidatus Vogelbacteria bacterium]
MCDIDAPTTRKKSVMEMELFEKILRDLAPYRETIEVLDLFGLGEPLLDPKICGRIRLAKEAGFKNVGISTNADILNDYRRLRLLRSGVDTVIISIDGATKETHEAIRRGSRFDRTVSNTIALIDARSQMGLAMKIIVRFIRQDLNRDEWPAFKKFWDKYIDRTRKDTIGVYDVHAQGPAISKKDALKASDNEMDEKLELESCPLIQSTLYILADGCVVPCSQDWLCGRHTFGTTKEESAIDIFNSPKFSEFREIHNTGLKNTIAMCAGCTIAYSDARKEYA